MNSQISTHEWSVNAWNIEFSTPMLNSHQVMFNRHIPCFWNMPMQIVSLFSSRKQTLHHKSVIWSLYRSILVVGLHDIYLITLYLFCIVKNYQCFKIFIKLNYIPTFIKWNDTCILNVFLNVSSTLWRELSKSASVLTSLL